MLDGRATLAQHRRLLITGGWLSLLAATCLIDLHRDTAAGAHLRTAAQLASETSHAELAAWGMETRAWQVLTAGEFRRATELSQGAQRLGDAAAEGMARQVLAAIEARDGRPRPRRAALARLDLALALVAAGKDDEAAGVGLEAVRSVRLAPVDGRRVIDIISAISGRDRRGARELSEAYREMCLRGDPDAPYRLPG